uniref:Uncharacterized protein n=1 Tax=Alexandrium catenella TaxID=2925 RepID=A0A7S1RG11_ALECA
MADGEPLPLCVRRVLSSLMPAARDPDLTPEAQQWCRREVESRFLRLLASRGKRQQQPKQPSALHEDSEVGVEPGEALLCDPEGEEAGEDSPGAENHEPLPEVLPPPRVGPLPTLLTSRPAWEKLLVALGEEKVGKVVDENVGERAS